MLKSFFVMLGCGEDKGRLVFLRHPDGLMTGGHCSGETSLSSELAIEREGCSSKVSA